MDAFYTDPGGDPGKTAAGRRMAAEDALARRNLVLLAGNRVGKDDATLHAMTGGSRVGKSIKPTAMSRKERRLLLVMAQSSPEIANAILPDMMNRAQRRAKRKEDPMQLLNRDGRPMTPDLDENLQARPEPPAEAFQPVPDKAPELTLEPCPPGPAPGEEE